MELRVGEIRTYHCATSKIATWEHVKGLRERCCEFDVADIISTGPDGAPNGRQVRISATTLTQKFTVGYTDEQYARSGRIPALFALVELARNRDAMRLERITGPQ